MKMLELEFSLLKRCEYGGGGDVKSMNEVVVP